MVNGDSLLVIQLARGDWKRPWHISQVISDIKGLALKFVEISWHHIFREANFVANVIAHVGMSLINHYV